MRCKLNDLVIVVKGTQAGATGEIVSPGSCGEDYWLVKFPRQMACILDDGRIIESKITNVRDSWLIPISPGGEPIANAESLDIGAVV